VRGGLRSATDVQPLAGGGDAGSGFVALRLPTYISSLVGRQRELADIARVLQTARLVTLTGAGGVGKTRLALAAASTELENFADGVWLASLGSLIDPALVPHSVAAIFGVRERGGRPLLEDLVEAVRERRLLLVLDNCEHLIDASAQLVQALLQGCPGVKVLATSRERLGVPGEVHWRVPSLGAPGAAAAPLHELGQYDAVHLFVERAIAVGPDFRLTSANAAAVAEVCWRLDGIPLAIELAAAWLGTLTVDEIAARLDDRFNLLVGGGRTAPPRQQTLRGAIEWSYDLLGQPEQRLWAALSVFAGGWTLDAAEAVCPAASVRVDADERASSVLALLRQLIEKSMVVVDQTPDGTRYRLLESQHAYAKERAQAAGDLPALERRHLEWCVALAQSVTLPWPDSEQVARLVREHDNLRAALRWCINRGEAVLGLRLAVLLWPLWYTQGLYAEGRAWLGALLALPSASSPTALRARGLAFAGYLSSHQGQMSEAEALLQEGLTTAEHAGAPMEQTLCSDFMGDLARRQGDLTEAAARFERTVRLAHVAGRRLWEAWAVYHLARVHWELGDADSARATLNEAVQLSLGGSELRLDAHVLALRGRLAALDGDHQAARTFEDQSLALLRTIGDQQGLAFASLEAAASALDRGDGSQAARHLDTALKVASESGEQLVLARGMEAVARAVTTTEPHQALRLAGAAAALRASLGLQPSAPDRERLESWVREAQRRLGEAGASAAWATGERDTVAQGVALARACAQSASAGVVGSGREHSNPGLTRREHEVALLMATGLSNRQVARALAITEGTARIHAERILGKLGLRSRVQVGAWARAQGLQVEAAD
jgi:predicted ATPase/DNA-binding CsgD family transcriptional regulator